MRRDIRTVAIEVLLIIVGMGVGILTGATLLWVILTIVGLSLVVIIVSYYPEITDKFGFSLGRDSYDLDSVEGRFKALHPFLKCLAGASEYSEADSKRLLNELDMLGICHPVDPTLWPKYLKVLTKLSKKGDLQRARDIPSWLILKD